MQNVPAKTIETKEEVDVKSLTRGDEITVTITGWNKSFQGLAKIGRKRVVVPGAIPGETIRGKIAGFWRRTILLKPVEILNPSDQRATPMCKHFATCAGCQFQHVQYEEQLSIKKEKLLDYFTEAEMPAPEFDMVPSTHPYHYRNSITVHGPGEPGFWSAGGLDMVRNEECPVCVEGVEVQLKDQRAKGFKKFLDAGKDNIMIRAASSGDTYVGPELYEGTHTWLTENLINPLTGEAISLQVPAHAFWQANTPMLETLLDHALRPLKEIKPSVFLEAYCGIGLFGLMAAPLVARVIAIEENPWAIEAAKKNAAALGYDHLYALNSKTEENLERFLTDVPLDDTVLLVDPPRDGLPKKVIHSILEHPPKHMIYVSCGPSSLVQNLKKLGAAYNILSFMALDMFPQTRHIECIAVLQRRD